MLSRKGTARSQTEIVNNIVYDVLLIQSVLTQMRQDHIRKDFLLGRNGAAKLTLADLILLDKLYQAVTPKHKANDPSAFRRQVDSAAEHLIDVIEGNSKKAFGSTFRKIREIIRRVLKSGYLNKVTWSSVICEETSEVVEPMILKQQAQEQQILQAKNNSQR